MVKNDQNNDNNSKIDVDCAHIQVASSNFNKWDDNNDDLNINVLQTNTFPKQFSGYVFPLQTLI